MNLIIDINQYPVQDVARATELRADGVWSVPGNSPGITAKDTKFIIAAIGSKIVVTEEGGMDPQHLLDAENWTGQSARINVQANLTREADYDPTRAMVYYEYSEPGVLQTCLTPYELRKAHILERKTPLLPMTRDWSRKQRARVRSTLTLPKSIVAGVTFEIEANVPLIKKQNILAGINYVHSEGREVWVLLSPRLPSVQYENDVAATLRYFKNHLHPEIWGKINIVLAVYEVENKGTSFFGETNSMLAAVKVARRWK